MSNIDFDWRLENRVFYPTLLEWWSAHNAFGGKVIPYENMPTRIFVVSRAGEDLFAVSVYVTDSAMCWIGWITSNPSAKLKSKYKALDFLHGIITTVMKSQGYKCIVSKTNERGLAKALDSNGYVPTEVTQFYIKNI